MSIDLGYAPLDLDGGRRVSLIDVPGHERFVRNMVAGATGIDLFLLVVDAAEGPRRQTHEHLRILRLLGIRSGVVAVTKADAVVGRRLEEALAEARQLVPESEAVAVSAKTGAGIDELRAALASAAANVRPRSSDGPPRLFVDRAFTLRGLGTIATGTLWSGSIGAGDVLAAEPGDGRVRVRSVEVHDEAGRAGRGGATGGGRPAARSAGKPSSRDRARGTRRLSGHPPARHPPRGARAVPPRVTVHHGSAETPARLRPATASRRCAWPRRSSPPPATASCCGRGRRSARDSSSSAPSPFRGPAAGRSGPPPPPDDGRVRLPGGLVLERAELDRARELVVAECEREGTVTLARARDLLGTSRRTAQAILERLDNDHVTLRVGDVRRLRTRPN